MSGAHAQMETSEGSFVDFVQEAEPRLRRALVVRYGSDLGRELTAAALAYGWENWLRLAAMDNGATAPQCGRRSPRTNWIGRARPTPRSTPSPGVYDQDLLEESRALGGYAGLWVEIEDNGRCAFFGRNLS